MEVMAGFGALLLFIVVIGLIASSARGGQRKVLGDVAQANGLAYTSEGVGHRIAGALDGRTLTMTAQPGHGGVQEERWILQLRNAPPDGMGATKKTMLGSVSSGSTRVVTGDSAFDGAVLAEARDVEGARAWLTEPRRAAPESWWPRAGSSSTAR